MESTLFGRSAGCEEQSVRFRPTLPRVFSVEETAMHTSRRISRETGKFVRVTPGSQSLERGIRILRAFLEGAPSLSNSELVERVHLPKATVSRLSRSLVDAGMLEFNPKEEAYRLAPS
jgi:predicted transcriptional regulator